MLNSASMMIHLLSLWAIFEHRTKIICTRWFFFRCRTILGRQSQQCMAVYFFFQLENSGSLAGPELICSTSMQASLLKITAMILRLIGFSMQIQASEGLRSWDVMKTPLNVCCNVSLYVLGHFFARFLHAAYLWSGCTLSKKKVGVDWPCHRELQAEALGDHPVSSWWPSCKYSCRSRQSLQS